jgi:AcrR family transcriptional regulator
VEIKLGLREKKKQATIETIFSVVEEAWSRQGASNLNMISIAEAAEVSMSTLYNYFDGKETLLKALKEHRLQSFTDYLKSQGDSSGTSFRERLKSLIAVMYQSSGEMARTQNFLKRIYKEEGDEDLHLFFLESFGTAAKEIFDSSVKSEILRPLPAELMGPIFIQMAERIFDSHQQMHLETKEALSLTVELFFEGFAA